MLQNKQYCVNWNLIEMVMQYLFSLSVIKPLKRCNSASINLGNTLHTLNRGKLSPELFASSFNLRSGGGVFKQHHQPFVPSSDRPRFTVRKATTALGRLTKQESHSRMFSVKIPGVRTMFPCWRGLHVTDVSVSGVSPCPCKLQPAAVSALFNKAGGLLMQGQVLFSSFSN